MPWVSRDDKGTVNGVYACAQDNAQEYLADTDPAVLAFQQKIQAVEAAILAKPTVEQRLAALELKVFGTATP